MEQAKTNMYVEWVRLNVILVITEKRIVYF